MTRPRVVVVELCVSRLNILRYDEQTILEEAKNLNMGKFELAAVIISKLQRLHLQRKSVQRSSSTELSKVPCTCSSCPHQHI